LKEVNTGGGDSVPRETMRKHNKGLRSSPIRGPFKTHLTTPPVKPNQLTQQANKKPSCWFWFWFWFTVNAIGGE